MKWVIYFYNSNFGSSLIQSSFVLFPYKDEEEYKNHDFYKSIEEVNIGAIPFLPSTTGLMEEFLDKLINESSYSTFERSLDSLGREEYIKDEYFKDRTVLVGSLRNKEQLEINLKGTNKWIPLCFIHLFEWGLDSRLKKRK